MSNIKIIGWDVGGAHIKAVALSVEREVIQALQLPCPLWLGLAHLKTTVEVALATFSIKPNDVLHVITMTGELVDLFQNRHVGVLEIAKMLNDILSRDGESIQFYAVNHGYVDFRHVSALSMNIASANWHASASCLATHVQDALLIDIGSTTTDIIPIQSGKVHTQNISDAQRMQADSLVYTGVVRTPVMAVANKLLLDGIETNVAAEYFATMADIYRLTGELPQEVDMADTADGKGKSLLESARRLARMVGHDLEDKPIETWRHLAVDCRNRQLGQIKMAVLKHLKSNDLIIGAGAGAFLVKVLADELRHAYLPVSQVLKQPFNGNHALELCFPAYAVANLFLTLNQHKHKARRHA
jgi:(4-(4-[2-(gamma-L-glutamylamino)ethyl]phenoxymethyl)furan-2-yl)methanamine synthase